MELNHVFFRYIKFFVRFYLLNPNPLSASRKSSSNFVHTQKTKMGAKKMRRVAIHFPSHETSSMYFGMISPGLILCGLVLPLVSRMYGLG